MNEKLELGLKWFNSMGWSLFPFQKQAWECYFKGYNGMVNAPTGSGKTYSIMVPAIIDYIHSVGKERNSQGVQMIWVTPIRALAKEILISSNRASEGLNAKWTAAIRSGDTNTLERNKQWEKPPQLLITTPESIHVLMTKKGYSDYFRNLKCIVLDEWHEMIGSKRGVQAELFLSKFRKLCPSLKVWGISATIGNLEESLNMMLGVPLPLQAQLIKSDIKKNIVVNTVLPDEIERFPWAGHLGLNMSHKILPIIEASKTTLIFTNTRAQSEIWYHRILESNPDLAGLIAMHHGSISSEVREWVENALYHGDLKVVVCTSSLDLGVDFRPVDTVIQIGSPKGVARFLQRAGRSGHKPGEHSNIYFVPTNTLELLEAASIKDAIQQNIIESRIPYIRSFDVMIQYLMTLAVSEGFEPKSTLAEIKTCYSFNSITDQEWSELLTFLVEGSQTLKAYDEYHRVGIDDKGIYRAKDKSTILRHKLSIGTIASASMLTVKYQRGKSLGSVEEYFISAMSPGDSFWFAGRALEIVRVKEMEVHVVNSKSKTAKIASYLGGRMPFSTEMAALVRNNLYNYLDGKLDSIEMKTIQPLLELQQERSLIANKDQLLVEYFRSKEGYHLIIYPFEGRNVHEGLAALLGSRISSILPISFSIAVNDYGFELLSDQEIEVESILVNKIFSTKQLLQDIMTSINSVELARRRFRDIARISGLVFQGFPGKKKKDRHLQSSSQLLFDVFREYDPDNLLFLQSYEELMTFQLEEARMRNTLEKIQEQEILIVRPVKYTPFAFPLMVDRLREKMSSESLEHRIEKMKLELIK